MPLKLNNKNIEQYISGTDVTELTWKGTKVSFDHLLKILQNNVSSLEKLTLANADLKNLDPSKLKLLIEQFGKNKALKKLNLINNNFGAEEATLIATLITSLPCLEELSIGAYQYNQDISFTTELFWQTKLQTTFASSTSSVTPSIPIKPSLMFFYSKEKQEKEPEHSLF